jgi:hypothetical protein
MSCVVCQSHHTHVMAWVHRCEHALGKTK